MFTRRSVHCADKMVAHNNSNGLVWSSSQAALGYSRPSASCTTRATKRFAETVRGARATGGALCEGFWPRDFTIERPVAARGITRPPLGDRPPPPDQTTPTLPPE